MVGKNNIAHQLEDQAKCVPHFGLRKLSVGVASVLLSTTLYFGATASADTNVPIETNNDANTEQATGSAASTQSQAVALSQASGTSSNADSKSILGAVSSTPANQTSQASTSSETSTSSQSAGSQVDSTANSSFDSSVTALMALNVEPTTFDGNSVSALAEDKALTENKAEDESNVVKYQAGTDNVNDQFNHYVHRTINITDPNNNSTSQVQTVHFVRRDAQGNAGYYDADHNLVYVDWTADSDTLPAVNLPSFNGYQAYDRSGSTEVSLDGKQVIAQRVTVNALDTTVNVVYRPVANIQKIQVVYNGNVLNDLSIIGNTGETKTVNQDELVPPDGYRIIDGQTVPTTVTFDGHAKTPIIIQAEPIVVTIDADNAKSNTDIVPGTHNVHFPSGVTAHDLRRTITRTVKITNPDDTVTNLTPDVVTFNRTATFNAVTGQLTYTNWDHNGQVNLPAVTAPNIDGYSTQYSENAFAVTVTSNNQDINVEVTYAPTEQSVNINYIDPYTGETIGNGQINGLTGQDVTYTVAQMQDDLMNSGIDQDFELVNPKDMNVHIQPNANDINVILTGKTIRVEHDQNVTDDDVMSDSMPYPDGVKHDDLNHTVTRTITVKMPDGATHTEVQHVDFTRGATVNLGQNFDGLDCVTYDAWSPASANLPAYAAPVVAGYTPSHSVNQQAVMADSDNLTDTITYIANAQGGNITYVDADGNTIGTTPMHGTTGQIISVVPEIPAGWEEIPGQSIPVTVTATADGIPGVSIMIRHHMITVVSNDVPNLGDKKLGNPEKKPGDGHPKTDVTHKDLNKSINRTFIVVDPHTGRTVHTQTISYQRIATIDDVTGDVTYSTWNTTGGSFRAEVVPVVAGYTSHVTAGDYGAYTPTQNQINNWTDPEITVTYTANDRNGSITYVDRDGNTIGMTPLTGKTDENVVINPQAPAGWKITPGQSIPTTVKVTSNGIEGLSIVVEHNLIVKHPEDVPNSGSKIPANPEKKPGDGTPKVEINYNSLHKTATRTIVIHDPHTGDQVNVQNIKFDRTATIDDATGDVTYSDWTVVPDSLQSKFTNVDYPTISGYALNAAVGNHGEQILTQDQINNWTDPQIEVSYIPQAQTGKISYVDGNGNEISHDDLTGATDEQVPIRVNIPANWKLVAGQNIPAAVTATSAGIPTVTVKIEHDHITVPATDPKKSVDKLPDGTNYPTGVDYDALNKMITRTIIVNKPGQPGQTITQEAKFIRNATIDLVNHDVTYTTWNLDNNGWVEYKAPAVAGYTPSQASVSAVAVTPNMLNLQVTINYLANAQTGKIVYVDNHHAMEVSHTDLAGNTGDKVVIHPQVPIDWKIVSGQTIPTTVTATATGIPTVVITIEHDTITVPANEPKMPSDKLLDGKNYLSGLSHGDLNKTATRTITINMPNAKPIVIAQQTSFGRNATVDLVSHDVTYGNWVEGQNNWKQVSIPAVDGYTASQNDVLAVNVTPETKDSNVIVNYLANNQSQVINYVDDHGRMIKSNTINGKTDQTVDIPVSVPDHYVLAPGQNIPFSVKLMTTNMPITVKVTPKLDLVTDSASLNKTISRTITINLPNQNPQVINQEANFVRTGQMNEVTGKTTYTDWQLENNSLKHVNVPTVAGYTPSRSSVDGIENPTADMTLENVVINYTANNQTQVINYVDGNGKTIKTDTVIGKTDQTVKVPVSVPDHYVLVPSQNIPSSVKLTTTNTSIMVKVTPKLDPVTDSSQLNKMITRTITINKPGQGPEVIKQEAKFSRTGETNEVTGKTTYTDWQLENSTLNYVSVPTVAGYTPSQLSVDGVENPAADMTLENVVINYTANNQTQVINYVDGNGKTVKTDAVTGKTDQTVKIPVSVPDRYVLVPGQNIPENVKLTNNSAPITVHVMPKFDLVTDPSQLNKMITRTITINKPGQGPEVIKQEAKFSRTGETNEVTGKTTFTPWIVDANGWTKVDVPFVAGYTPTQSTVGAVNTMPDMSNVTVTINYLKNAQTGKISYVDGNGNEISHTDLAGHTGDSVTINPQAPLNWKIVPGQIIPTSVVAGPDGILTVTIHVEHDTVLVPSTDPKMSSDKLLDGDHYPNGVARDDLNKTITRTIMINVPGREPQVIKQEVKFTRNATVDLVDHDVVYTNWKTGQNGWTAFDAPVIDGYTASQKSLAAVYVASDMNDVTMTINYVADNDQTTINYVDQNGNPVGNQVVSGEHDSEVSLKLDIPDGYQLDQSVPETIKIDGQELTVKVKKIVTDNGRQEPDQKSEQKPDQKSEQKPEQKPDQKPEQKPSGEPENGQTISSQNVSEQISIATQQQPQAVSQGPVKISVAKTDKAVINNVQSMQKPSELPQTGDENQNSAAALAGLLGLTGLAAMFGFKKRKHD